MTNSLNDEQDIQGEFQQLAYLIVHHLKEPARAIRTGAEMLRELRGKPGGEEAEGVLTVASCADRILRGAGKLDDITGSIARYADDLADMDEIMQDANTAALFRTARQKLQPLIEETRATVTSGALPELRCQRERFSRLLEHLLRNAILYHRELAPEVHVSAEQQGESWLFSVRDNGTGIPAPELERIFQPFSRLSSKGYKGLGMGLTSSRRIVAAHGGRIWAESELGIGSTFFFTVSR